jgi:NAD(P)H-dependent FMN reductase
MWQTLATMTSSGHDVILAISGSLRRASYNTMLARAAASLASRCPIELVSIRDIPLYDGDLEAEGIPASVTAIKDRIAGARGLLLVTPEYNNSLPGVLKNALDWMTRPSSDIGRVFGGLPIGLMGATPGPGGTRLAQTAWLPVLRQLGCHPFFAKSLYVSSAASVFDAEGNVVDEKIRKLLAGYVEAFTEVALATTR